MRFGIIAAALAALPAFAQLAAPNDAGFSMGHVHLFAKDITVHQKFFGLLGGKAVMSGSLPLIQFPGVFINLRQDMPVAGTVGSQVDHFGFHVKSVAAALEAIKPMGFKVQQNNPQQAFVTAADDVKVELLEDANMPVPIRMHHVHMFVLNPADVQAWYGKVFGGVPGKRGMFDTVSIPGVEISLTKVDASLAPTKSRSLDHIGFEVKSMDAAIKRLESMGLRLADGPRIAPNGTTKIGFMYDPWGTYIELTEGLAPKS